MNEDTISERAVRASSIHREHMREFEMGVGANRLFESLYKASKVLPAAIENTKSGGKGKYVPLDVLLTTLKPILLEHGLMVRQGQERSYGADDGGSKTRIYPVYTDIIHAFSGEMHRTTIEVPVPRMDAQGVGSAITYGKRYSLLAALGIATADDVADDDGAAGRKREITEPSTDSPELAKLKAQIDGIKDVEKLLSFSVGASGQQLDEGEFAVLREHWRARRTTLEQLK